MATGQNPWPVCNAGLHTQPGAPSAYTGLTAQLYCGYNQHPLSHGVRLGATPLLVCFPLVSLC